MNALPAQASATDLQPLIQRSDSDFNMRGYMIFLVYSEVIGNKEGSG